MLKRLFWVGIGATAGWLGHQKFQEKKLEVTERIQQEGNALPGALAKQAGEYILAQARTVLSSTPKNTPHN